MHCKALLCILVLPCAVRGATVSRTSALTTTALQEAQFVPSLCSLTPTIPLPSFDSQHYSPATQAGFIAPDASCPFCLHSTQHSTSAEAPATNDYFGGFDGQCFARQYETEPNRRFSSIWLQSWGSESLTAACDTAYLVTNPVGAEKQRDPKQPNLTMTSTEPRCWILPNFHRSTPSVQRPATHLSSPMRPCPMPIPSSGTGGS